MTRRQAMHIRAGILLARRTPMMSFKALRKVHPLTEQAYLQERSKHRNPPKSRGVIW